MRALDYGAPKPARAFCALSPKLHRLRRPAIIRAKIKMARAMRAIFVSEPIIPNLVAGTGFELMTFRNNTHASGGPRSVRRPVTVARREGSMDVTISHTRPSSITA